MTSRRDMPAYTGLAGRYLRQQRKRTVLTIMAVVLSVALITSAGVFAQSIRELGVENVRARFGGFYAKLWQRRAADLDRLELHAAVDEVGSTIRVGIVELTDELSMRLLAPDSGWVEAQGYEASTGRLPRGPGEIAVERWIFQAARRPVELGDAVELDVMPCSSDGQGAAGGDEQPQMVTRRFTIVGFLDSASVALASGSSSSVISQRDAVEILGEDAPYVLGFTTKPELDPQEGIASVAASFGVPFDEVPQNTALLASMGESGATEANDALRTVEVIVALILVVATVAVIYNSFTISVIEQIRQFGILRTVGATPRQIRRIVYRQAGAIAAIGAPLGVGAGLIAVRIVVLAFQNLATDVGFAGVQMTFPPAVLIGAPILGALSVYASAVLPARSAGRVSPMEAVLAEGRFVKDRVRRRRAPVLRRLFGIAGQLASQNLRRHPGRFAVTVFSIGIGVALFVTFAGCFTILSAVSSNVGSEDLRGDITVTVRGEDPTPIEERRRELIEGLPGIESVTGVFEVSGAVGLPPAGFGDWDDGVGGELADEVRALAETTGPVVPVSVLGVDESALRKLRPAVMEGWRSPAELSQTGGVYVQEGLYEVGDEFPFAYDGRIIRLPVVGLADSLPSGNVNQITVVTTVEVARVLTDSQGYTGFEVTLDDDAPDAAGQMSLEDAIRSIEAVIGNRSDVFAFDMGSVEESGDQVSLQISILLYGLVAVVALIGALNIVNTITTNLLVRTREFGTLRAVGMSAAQMRGMIRIESALYGLWAVAGGAAVGVALTRLLFNNVSELQAIPWQVPWVSIAAGAVAAVALCLLSAALPMKRIAGMNIVESIRNAE